MMGESHFVLPLPSPPRRSLHGSGFKDGHHARMRGIIAARHPEPGGSQRRCIGRPSLSRRESGGVGVLSTPAAHVVLSFELPEHLQAAWATLASAMEPRP